MNILSIFAERLKELIFDNRTSPEKLSSDLSHNVYDIYHWMSPNNKYMPTVSNLIKLADYFNCSLDYLVGTSDDIAEIKRKPVLPKFSERFLYVLKEKDRNLYKLGRLTKTSTTTYYRWINGFATPTIDSLIKVSEALDCTLDYLIGRE